MSIRPPIMFVLLDASRRQGPLRSSPTTADAGPGAQAAGTEFIAMVDDGHGPCVLVRAADLDGIDAELEAWMLATATRLADAQSRYDDLTPRERQALPLITDGLLNKQAASVLGISEATLQIHRGRIMHKMRARSLAELVRLADVLGVSSGRARFEDARDTVRPHRAQTRLRRTGGGSAA